MATFRKRSNAWQARIQRSGYPDQSKTFNSRSEAVAWARAIEHEFDKYAHPLVSPKATLGDLLNRYLNEITPQKKGASVETYRIRKWLKHFLALREISVITSEDLSRWRDESQRSGISANSIRLELAILSHLFNIAIEKP